MDYLQLVIVKLPITCYESSVFTGRLLALLSHDFEGWLSGYKTKYYYVNTISRVLTSLTWKLLFNTTVAVIPWRAKSKMGSQVKYLSVQVSQISQTTQTSTITITVDCLQSLRIYISDFLLLCTGDMTMLICLIKLKRIHKFVISWCSMRQYVYDTVNLSRSKCRLFILSENRSTRGAPCETTWSTLRAATALTPRGRLVYIRLAAVK